LRGGPRSHPGDAAPRSVPALPVAGRWAASRPRERRPPRRAAPTGWVATAGGPYSPARAFATSSAYSFSTGTAGPGRTFRVASTGMDLGGKQLLLSHTSSLNEVSLTVAGPGVAFGDTTA